MRLVLVNGSFGCRTIAARTRDLIPVTLWSFTVMYRFRFSFFQFFNFFLGGNLYDLCGTVESCRDPSLSMCLRRDHSPKRLSWVPAAMLRCD